MDYMPRNRAVVVVLHNNSLLVMFRKNTREYYTIPGGGVKPGETPEQAALREIKEETSLAIALERPLYELHHDNGDIHYYFLGRYLDGTPAVQVDTNEYKDNQQGDNLHLPQWMPVGDIPNNLLYPIDVRDRLVEDIQRGFSNEVVKFKLTAHH